MTSGFDCGEDKVAGGEVFSFCVMKKKKRKKKKRKTRGEKGVQVTCQARAHLSEWGRERTRLGFDPKERRKKKTWTSHGEKKRKKSLAAKKERKSRPSRRKKENRKGRGRVGFRPDMAGSTGMSLLWATGEQSILSPGEGNKLKHQTIPIQSPKRQI